MTCNGSHSAMSLTRSHSLRPVERADDAVDPVAHAVLELGDPAGREALVDQLAQLGVDRRVLADEQLRHRVVAVLGHLRVEERVGRVAEGRRVARDALHVGVAGDDPVAALPGGVVVVRHRVVGAQVAERVVREAVGEGRGIVEHGPILTRHFTRVQKYVRMRTVQD